jgi:hypothetical protein
MEEKEPKPKDSIQYILERLSEILPQDVSVDGDDTSFTSATTEIDVSPEEGGRLIRAFIRIKHPELRAAIIKLTTRVGTLNYVISQLRIKPMKVLQIRNCVYVLFSLAKLLIPYRLEFCY